MTAERSRDFVEASLKLADRALEGARILLDRNDYSGSVSRAYYAVFHAARAMLYSKSFTAKTHSGLISLFGGHIVRKGEIPKEFAEILAHALDLRLKSDYEVFTRFRDEEVRGLVADAERFLEKAKQILRSH